MRTGVAHIYQTNIGFEFDKLNNSLEKKLNEKIDSLKFEMEKNYDTLSLMSVKTTIDL